MVLFFKFEDCKNPSQPKPFIITRADCYDGAFEAQPTPFLGRLRIESKYHSVIDPND